MLSEILYMNRPPHRIVPLIASATEMVHALGLGHLQVGRSHECDYPEAVRALPVCTAPRIDVTGSSGDIDARVKASLASAESIYEVFEDVLLGLAPTVLLTQTQCKVCAVSMDDVERALSERFVTRPAVVALEPNSLADIWRDLRRVASACGVSERGESLIAALGAEMEAMHSLAEACASRPKVAIVEWQEPLMAAGNWTPELVDLACGVNLFGEARRHSPWMAWEDLLAANPDVVIVAPCGYGLNQARREMYWLTRRPGWDRLAGRTFLADGNAYFNRPGPRVVETLRTLCEILHPTAFAPSLAGVAWEPFGE